MVDSKRDRRKNKRKKTAILPLVLAALLFLGTASCAKDEPSPTDPPVTLPPVQTTVPTDNGGSNGKTRGLPGSRKERVMVGLAEPALYNTNPFASGKGLFPVDPQGICQPLYQTLLLYDPAALVYLPHLAESVIPGEDGVTVRLDGERSWHDGYPVTSRDLLFSIEAHQVFETEAGRVFSELALELTADEETVLEVRWDSGQDRALPRLLDAFSKALILPAHIWQPLTADGLPSEGTSLPMVGSGPWAFLSEDEFSLSFERKKPESSKEALYLTVLKYTGTGYAGQALETNNVDWLLGSTDQLSEDLVNIWRGEILAGITVNPSAGDWLPVRSVRQLLSLAADPETTGELLFPENPAIGRTCLLTVPSAMDKLNEAKLQESLLVPDQDTLDRLMEDAGLAQDPETGFLISQDGSSLPALVLIYPKASEKAEEACQVFQDSAKKLGFNVVLRAVQEEQWKNSYETGRYDLIYWETRANETPADLASRLEQILPLDEYEGQLELEKGRELIARMEDAQDSKTRVGAMEELTLWLMDEALFIPLGAGRVPAGLWNMGLMSTFDFKSVLPGLTD